MGEVFIMRNQALPLVLDQRIGGELTPWGQDAMVADEWYQLAWIENFSVIREAGYGDSFSVVVIAHFYDFPTDESLRVGPELSSTARLLCLTYSEEVTVPIDHTTAKVSEDLILQCKIEADVQDDGVYLWIKSNRAWSSPYCEGYFMLVNHQVS